MKKFILLCVLALFPIQANAYSKQELIEEKQTLQNEVDSLDSTIDSIEKKIETFQNTTYSKTIISHSNNKQSNYYENNNSFLNENEIISQEEQDWNDLLLKKQKEKKETLEHIDRNNFLIERFQSHPEFMFDPENVTILSNIEVEEAREILKGTNLEPLAQDYIDAEREYQVNALFLMSICAIESGWGTSRRAIEDNNLTGLGVYSNSSVGLNSDTKRGNIMATAERLHNNYLQEDGCFYHGLSVEGVRTSYCVTPSWTDDVTRVGLNLLSKLNNLYGESY